MKLFAAARRVVFSDLNWLFLSWILDHSIFKVQQCFCLVSENFCNLIRCRKMSDEISLISTSRQFVNFSKIRHESRKRKLEKLCLLKREKEEEKYLKFQKFQKCTHNTRMKLLRFASLLGKSALSTAVEWSLCVKKKRKKNHEIFYVARLCLCAAQFLTLKSNWARSPNIFQLLVRPGAASTQWTSQQRSDLNIFQQQTHKKYLIEEKAIFSTKSFAIGRPRYTNCHWKKYFKVSRLTDLFWCVRKTREEKPQMTCTQKYVRTCKALNSYLLLLHKMKLAILLVVCLFGLCCWLEIFAISVSNFIESFSCWRGTRNNFFQF